MKIKDASDKVNEALDGAAAKVERARLTKWVLVALAVVVLLLVAAWFTKARATGYEHAVVIVKTVPVVAPPVVVPPPAPVPVPPPSSGAAPVQPSGGGNGPGAMGWYVMGGVAVFFWAVICVSERAKNPDGFWARHMCLKSEPRA